MKNNSIKTPMIAGIILQGVAVAIGVICYFAQKSLGAISSVQISSRVLPDTLVSMTVELLLHIICLLVMQPSQGQSPKTIGVIMTVVYCVVNIASGVVSRISAVFASRTGVEYVAARSVLSSTISMLTSPLCFISLALVFIAIGRFGVLGYRAEE